MSILSGFFKTKRYRKTADGYKLESNWTSGNTVELDDGNTVQNNLGAIKGITTSTSVTEEGYAADATTVAALNNNLVKRLPYYDISKGQGSASVWVDDINGAYLLLNTSPYRTLLKQFYNGALTFQYSKDEGSSWTDLLRLNESDNSATFKGAIIDGTGTNLTTHNTKDLLYFYTVNSTQLTTSTVGSYEIKLNLTYKAGYTPFTLNCNFIGATGLSINSVSISSDRKEAIIWYNVERAEPRNFYISLNYFLIKDAR